MCGWKVLIWNRNYSRTTTYRVNLCIMDLFCGPAAWGPVSRKMDNPIGCGPGSGINKKGGVGGQSLSRHGSRLLPAHHSEALCGTDLRGPQCRLVFEKLQDDGRDLTPLPRGKMQWWIWTDAAIHGPGLSMAENPLQNLRQLARHYSINPRTMRTRGAW